MNIQTLREELHQRKVRFDQVLSGQPLLDRAQRLAKWESFLVEVRPLAIKLARLETQAERYVRRKNMSNRQYSEAASL